MEAEAAVHGAAAEEVPVAEVPAGDGKTGESDRETGLFFMPVPCISGRSSNNGKPFSTSIFSSKEIIKMFGKAG